MLLGSLSTIPPRDKIRNPEELNLADHIEILSEKGYKHHAIVINKYSADNPGRINVIHFDGQNKSNAIVKSDWLPINFSNTPVHRVQYPKEDCYIASVVLERAKDRLGQNLKGYDFFFNNCEHFARWAKCGKPMSLQATDFLSKLVDTGVGASSAAAKEIALALVAGEMIMGMLGAAWVDAIPVAVIILIKAKGLYDKFPHAKTQLRNGQISLEVFHDVRAEIAFKDGLECLGAIGGMIAGQYYLPIPFRPIGSLVGSSISSVISSFIGSTLGSALFYVIGSVLHSGYAIWKWSSMEICPNLCSQ